jgi:hypothetical protein
MDFKGFDDWVEVFRGGKVTDSAGKEHNGNALIEKALANFDAQKHTPPLVVGHPKDNHPAFGWVEGLKKKVIGSFWNRKKILLAKFRDVVPEFVKLVEQGQYKKRSASFYPDGTLRHIGFLGAMPPAIKGLADLKFEDDKSVTFNFQEETSMSATWEDFMKVFTAGRESAEPAKNDPPPAKKDDPPAAGFSEADVKKLVEEAAKTAADAERKKVAAEFAEKAAIARTEAVKKEISEFVEKGKEDGKIIPAWEKMGLAEFMQSLDHAEEISFAEGKKTNRLTWFREFLDELGKVVDFEEVAKRDKTAPDAAGKLEALIGKKMKETGGGYATAFTEVCVENPELAEEYRKEI